MVVVNKVDRADARVTEVVHEIEELFLDLDADEDQVGFPVLYANARAGRAGTSPDAIGPDLVPLFDAIVESVPPPQFDPDAPLQALVTNLDASPYLGRLGHLPGPQRDVAPGRDRGVVPASTARSSGARSPSSSPPRRSSGSRPTRRARARSWRWRASPR